MSQIDTSPNVMLPPRVPKSEFVAGRLSLAFCNTVALPDAADRLADPAALAAWSTRAGYGMATPAPSVHADFLTLRGVLRGIFGALAAGANPSEAALGRLSGAATPPRLRWNDDLARAESVPVAHDAAQALQQAIVADAIGLLTGDAVIRIKQCPAHDCRWFFFDTSKNGKRRWCAMADCGVKDKVGRYRARRAPSF